MLFPNLTDALKSGLLSKVVPEEKLEEEVNAIATKIASLSQPVVAVGKVMFLLTNHERTGSSLCVSFS